jgi:hypothetical protein
MTRCRIIGLTGELCDGLPLNIMLDPRRANGAGEMLDKPSQRAKSSTLFDVKEAE